MIESKTQIDLLGDRLRKGVHQEADLRQLDAFRRSFAEAYDTVVALIYAELGTEPSGRLKTKASIIEKLRRESIRLSQMQDVAGCRLVVLDGAAQDEATAKLRAAMPNAEVIDRRANPSHGYRAVHVIATIADRHVEIQIRTELQDLWAEISEKLADSFGPDLKYGRGDAVVQDWLLRMSRRVEHIEALIALRDVTLAAGRMKKLPQELVDRLAEIDREVSAARHELGLIHKQLASIADRAKRGPNALPD